jgi:transcriptional regulator with GAF, ATPase, and Fis domain
MEPFQSVLLDVWRETCRHIEIDEAVRRISPHVAAYIPAQHTLIRQLVADRQVVETVAVDSVGVGSTELSGRSQLSPTQFQFLSDWCRRREVLRTTTEDLQRELPGLLSMQAVGQAIVAGLSSEHGVCGVLVLLAHPGSGFTLEHLRLGQALQEPLTVALENDQRLRELVTLREKAEAENRTLLSKLGRQDITETIVGAESGLREVMERVALVAKADVPVLIFGETGSGKEVVARAIHRQSRRAAGPFLRVNCGAIPPELVDSELFGHEKGSFTGAGAVRKGWFERADGGTLFLDECGELTAAAQVRLLRVLQDGTFERVGGERQLHVNVRVVAATHRPLQKMVNDGTFREDLWYRLAVFSMELPPLRERLEDLPSMAAHFAARSATRLGLRTCLPTPDEMRLLLAYSWPGNVRELAAVLERAAILGNGERLDVATALGKPTATVARRQADNVVVTAAAAGDTIAPLDVAMRRHIERALAQTAGRIEGRFGAAAILEINPFTLRARMRKLGIDWSRFRVSARHAQ